MKKFLSLLLTLAVVLGALSGCGSKEEAASEAAKSVETITQAMLENLSAAEA